jgi:hypothetical protein
MSGGAGRHRRWQHRRAGPGLLPRSAHPTAPTWCMMPELIRRIRS